jgi:DNA modification methylase
MTDNIIKVDNGTILIGNVLDRIKDIPDNSVQTMVTSPPYWGLRDYNADGQLGQEETPEDFVENLCKIFDEVWRVLKDDGTVWLNLGDSYSGSGKGAYKDGVVRLSDKSKKQKTNLGSTLGNFTKQPYDLKPKNLIGIPWRVAFALQARGWILRQDIIWSKPNPMPESVRDRCTKAHEYIFLLTKNAKYYYDNEAIKEDVAPSTIARMKRAISNKHKNINGAPGQTKHSMNQPREHDPSRKSETKRNKRSVWTVSTAQYKGAHFAVFPESLVTPCILAGSQEGDIVLDIFSGSGTTGVVALKNNRKYIGIELNADYALLQKERLEKCQ